VTVTCARWPQPLGWRAIPAQPIDMDEGHVSEDQLNEEPTIHAHAQDASADSAAHTGHDHADHATTYRRADRHARINENAQRDRRRRAAIVAAAVAGVLVLLLAVDAVAWGT